MGRLVPPSQELRWSRTILPPFPSRLPRLSLLTSLLYHTLGDLSRGFLNFFRSVGRFCFTSPNYALGRGCSLLSASLHPYCIILRGICQVLYFFEKILDENLVVFRGSFPSPLPSLYHTGRWLSRGFPNFFYFLFWNRLRRATLTVDSVSPNPLVVSKPSGSRGD